MFSTKPSIRTHLNHFRLCSPDVDLRAGSWLKYSDFAVCRKNRRHGHMFGERFLWIWQLGPRILPIHALEVPKQIIDSRYAEVKNVR